MPTRRTSQSPFALATVKIPREDVLCRLTIHGDPKTKSPADYGLDHIARRLPLLKSRITQRVQEAYPAFTPNRTHDLGVSAVFYTKTNQRRDLDNMIKLLLDACTGVIWGDDMQVCEVMSRVERAHKEPRLHLIVYRIGPSYLKLCETCQTPLHAWTITISRSRNARFCSKECYDAAQRKGQYVYCSTCHKRIYRQNDKLKQKRWFCSSECRSISIRAHRLCAFCQQEFFCPGSQSSFCSDQCRQAWHDKKRPPSQRRGICPTCQAPSTRQHGKDAQCWPCYRNRKQEPKPLVFEGQCPHGHPRTPENVYVYKGKIHHCLRCKQENRAAGLWT